jgi:RHS repeat-associated protein
MGSATISASFQYDAAGRRAVKEVNGATSRLVYDGLNAISDYSSTGLRAAILPGLRADETLGRFGSSGIQWLLPDTLGSTIALTTSTGGVPTQYTYDPFGTTSVTGTADLNPYQYAGRENDSTGLYYNRARYFHPIFQRFISLDPLVNSNELLASRTPYEYALNNPLAWRDPTGLQAACGAGGVYEVRFDHQEFGGGAGGDFGSADFYGTPQGQLIEAPPGYQPVPAENGRGLVLQPEGQAIGDNSNIIRWGEPNAQNPDGYFRYYNDLGQPLDPATGRPGPDSATHIPPDYQGPLNGYPGR